MKKREVLAFKKQVFRDFSFFPFNSEKRLQEGIIAIRNFELLEIDAR